MVVFVGSSFTMAFSLASSAWRFANLFLLSPLKPPESNKKLYETLCNCHNDDGGVVLMMMMMMMIALSKEIKQTTEFHLESMEKYMSCKLTLHSNHV